MKLFYLIIFVFIASLIGVSASCCQFDDDQCTYFDLGNWGQAEIFCTNTGTALNLGSTYYNEGCSELNIDPECCDGWTNCNENIPGPGSSSSSSSSSRHRCVEDWECTEWGECEGHGTIGSKARRCTDLNDCGTTINEPDTLESCALSNELLFAEEENVEENTETEVNVVEETSFIQRILNTITGAATGPRNTVAGISILFLIIIIGLGVYRFKIKMKEGKK